MLRRDVFKALLALPFVDKVQKVTSETKAIIFCMRKGYDGNPREVCEAARMLLNKAGLSHVQPIITMELDVHVIDEPEIVAHKEREKGK